MSGRILTEAMHDDLGNATTAPVWLVEIEFDSGTLRLWSGVGEISAMGETWTGTGRLAHIAPIRETQDAVASGVEMRLFVMPTDTIPDAVDAFLNIALAEQYQGRKCTIYWAHIDLSPSWQQLMLGDSPLTLGNSPLVI